MRTILLLALPLAACDADPALDGNDVSLMADDQAPPPPALNVGGSCPGVVSIGVTNATPGGTVFVVSGSGPGNATIPSGPCRGRSLGLANPVLRATRTANAQGATTITPNVPSQFCSHYVQVVDAASCTTGTATPLTGAGQTFEIGGQTSSWTATNYFRGNVFTNVNGGTLADYDVYLDAPAGCALDFYVHARSPGGAWSVMATNTQIAAGGAMDYNSGPMGVSMSPGTEYGVGVAWNCSATYYGDNGTFAGDYGVGTFVQNYWDNAYGGYSPSFVPGNTGSASLAYDHAYNVQ